MEPTLCDRWAAWKYSNARAYCRDFPWLTATCGVLALVNVISGVIVCGLGALLDPNGVFILLAIAHGVLAFEFTLLGLFIWERRGFVRLLDAKDRQIDMLRDWCGELQREREPLLTANIGDGPESRFREQGHRAALEGK